MVKNLENQVWWYKYANIDDFEINSIVNEIDAHYKYDSIQDVMDNKKSRFNYSS